ncbi:MAG: helix-turn-helix domain-containing protein [Bacteroidota bacterium]|nr:MAG: helix-turn-helix domain-containing protein [Bacteroidota bacterium]
MQLRMWLGVFVLMVPSLVFAQNKVSILIEALPRTTPVEDTLYICGSFNDWNVKDANYVLHRQLDGKYAVSLQLDTNWFEYKFSRGSWLKIETNEKNEYLPNRVYSIEQGGLVLVRIQNWQDLGGIQRFEYLVFFLFAAAFYGLALLYIAYRIKKRNPQKFTAFLLLCLPVIFVLLGGVLYNQINLIWRSYLGMLAHLMLFAWGPLLFVSLKALRSQLFPVRLWGHFIPFGIVVLLSVLRLMNFKPLAFLASEINPYLTWGSSIVIWSGFVVVVFYHAMAWRFLLLKGIKNTRFEFEQRLVNTVYFISTAAVLILALDYFLLLFEVKLAGLANFEIVLMCLSLIILALFYYLWKYPDILKDKPVQLVSEEDEQIILLLEEVMNTKKPYLNPELNIAELSELMETRAHILSRLINDRYQKNFRDYINEYRVNEFIKQVNADENKNYTYLAIAFDVGFNSKSTFNLAFKKFTNTSPRDYFKLDR